MPYRTGGVARSAMRSTRALCPARFATALREARTGPSRKIPSALHAPQHSTPGERSGSTKSHHPQHHRSPLFEEVVARVGGDGPRALDVGQSELRQQLVDPLVARPVLEARTEAVRRPPTPARASAFATVDLPSSPPPGPGNARPAPPDSPRASSSTLSAPVDSGTRCARPRFMCAAGTVHTAPSKSNSSHSARRTSACLAAVNTRQRYRAQKAVFIQSVIFLSPHCDPTNDHLPIHLGNLWSVAG